MATGDAKWSVAAIVREHRKSYVAADGSKRVWDYLIIEWVPVGAALVAFFIFQVNLSAVASDLIAAASIAAVLLFGAFFQISDRADLRAAELPDRGPATTERSKRLVRVAANAAYASVVCLVETGVLILIVYLKDKPGWIRALSALAVGLGLHLLLVLLMVIKRMYADIQLRTTDMRVAGDPPANRPEYKASGPRVKRRHPNGTQSEDAAPPPESS